MCVAAIIKVLALLAAILSILALAISRLARPYLGMIVLYIHNTRSLSYRVTVNGNLIVRSLRTPLGCA